MFRSLRSSLVAIGLAGLIAAAALLTQALWSFDSLDRSARGAMVAKDVVADILPPPMYLIELRLTLSRLVEGTLSLEQATKDVDRLQAEYEQRVAYWQANPPFGLEAQLLGKQHEVARELITAARSEVLDEVQAGDTEAARRGLKVANDLYLTHRSYVDVTVRAGNEFAQRSIASFDATRESGNWIMPTVALTLLIAIGSCYMLAHRSILRPVQQCVDLASAVAAGDLTRILATDRDDELGELQRALADMRTRLAGLVDDVREGIDRIATASTQIVSGNDDLADRTQRQAAALQETASSMEQVTATVKQNADSAAVADNLTTGTRAGAERGETVVRRTIAAMEGITASSRRVRDIISVIDEIAFQTNLLALNAAVEAARAGEQGRGFAVVATEVRALAQRSAAAAKEIKELISDSVGKVESGSQLVNESGMTLGAIIDGIQRVGGIVGEIAIASIEQARGIEQVNHAVAQMDATTQENAALVEQAAAASKLMQDQARQLVRRMAFFRTRGSGVTHVAPEQEIPSTNVAVPRPAHLVNAA